MSARHSIEGVLSVISLTKSGNLDIFSDVNLVKHTIYAWYLQNEADKRAFISFVSERTHLSKRHRWGSHHDNFELSYFSHQHTAVKLIFYNRDQVSSICRRYQVWSDRIDQWKLIVSTFSIREGPEFHVAFVVTQKLWKKACFIDGNFNWGLGRSLHSMNISECSLSSTLCEQQDEKLFLFYIWCRFWVESLYIVDSSESYFFPIEIIEKSLNGNHLGRRTQPVKRRHWSTSTTYALVPVSNI